MCSSSELQRITLSATKIISAEGSVELEPVEEDQEAVESDEDTLEGDNEAKTGDDHSTAEIVTPVSAAPNYKERGLFDWFMSWKLKFDIFFKILEIGYTNGIDSSPTKANDTIMSGDISTMTIDSVKDHLNSTVSTICSQTTEEIVGMFNFYLKFSYEKLDQILVILLQHVQNLLNGEIDQDIVDLQV